ncbi:cobalamin biosynthesis protein CobD/CbiB [Gluconacetobacter johannae DSM 13595]|uniref:Cobalamin biosynthesis protein CobD n=1 Tax=Gluconacetobacter johannae TaxID=112140 RepID=A0A7W4P285_9PROT|nr:adenosylcobinamide-phosphate synthase CbiB [Gluconacetobacter johannae]MBB2174866.1 cobalamin biosynthesis protein CobD [Gluconacetobacter johannae]GBQ87584.1 cobalamin biosynthesis protein CobD/CbiB [Gluconacetobacter johannae DSM 13595]
MLIALMLDGALGWPHGLYARIGHPVTWLGALIGAGDRRLNREKAGDLSRRITGVVLAGAVIALAAGMALAISRLLPGGRAGLILTAILAWPLVAARSLHDHVTAVARPLAAGDLAGARKAVSMIVGRNPTLLDGAGIARAAAESLAENASDGIVAPLFWGMLLGLPGIAAYKAINTMDSMIGHRTPRHEAFGWAAARIDDVANLVPARLTGLLFALASARPATALTIMLRDARSHRSPNAGWPEAAFAGALGIRLSGPRTYADRIAQEPWLNGDAPDPQPGDLARGLALYRRAMVMLAAIMALIVLMTGRP